MYRSLWRVPLRSSADSLCKSKTPDYGRKNVAAKLESPQTFTTSNGHGCFGYGEESTIRSLRGKIVDALHLGERSKASSLLSDLGRGNYSLRANDFVHILEYCARSPDPLFAMETWGVMEEKEVVVNNRSCLLSIQALCKGGYLEEAFKLLNSLGENHDVYPTLPIYNNFLGACTQMRSVHHANQCLDLMERQLVGKDEVTYLELLKLAVLQKNLSAVYEIWNEYIKYYSLSIIALRKFVWSFTSLRDLKSAYETLQRMVGLASRGSIFISKNAEGKFYSSRLNIPIPSNNELGLKKCGMKKNEHSVPLIYDGCKKINTHAGNTKNCTILGMGSGEVECLKVNILKKYKSMPVVKVLRWSFNEVIRACAKARNYKLAEQLILQMQNLGLEPSCHTYDGYIRAVVSRKGYSKGMEVLKVMQQKNLKPYNSTLAIISISCSKVLELDLAEALLDQVSEAKSVHPFNAFLAACDSMDQPERAVRMMSKMRQLKLQPDIRTYELLFSLFGNVNAPYEEGNMLSRVDAAKRINAIEMDMVKHGIQHSYLSMRNLLKALGKEGTISYLKALGAENPFFCSNTYLGKPIYNTVSHSLVKAKELKAFGTEGTIRDLIQYLSVAKNQFRRSNTYLGTSIYNAVLHSLVKAKESHLAIEIFKNMRSCHCLPDAATYNIMIDCCSIIRCYKSACALVSMMVRDGYCLQRVTYTTLIKVLLECEDFDGALNLMDQASSEGIKPDLLLYNTILEEAGVKGRIDVIEYIVVKMHQHKIRPDPSTCNFVFSAYVDRGFLSTGVEALQVLSMRMISDEETTPYKIKKIFGKDIILAEDLKAESRIFQHFKNSKETLAVALLNLRWCAMIGFSISWFPNRSLWTKRLMSRYGDRKKFAFCSTAAE